MAPSLHAFIERMREDAVLRRSGSPRRASPPRWPEHGDVRVRRCQGSSRRPPRLIAPRLPPCPER